MATATYPFARCYETPWFQSELGSAIDWFAIFVRKLTFAKKRSKGPSAVRPDSPIALYRGGDSSVRPPYRKFGDSSFARPSEMKARSVLTVFDEDESRGSARQKADRETPEILLTALGPFICKVLTASKGNPGREPF